MGNIINIPLLERPYEKLKFFGPETLSDSELLSIIINTGTKDKSALEIAQEMIIKNQNELKFLICSSIDELGETSGIGTTKAIQLKAVGEISKRISKPALKKCKIKTKDDVVSIIGDEMRFEKVEKLKLILLNNQNNIVNIKTIAIGSESNIMVNIKQIFSEAIKNVIPKIILVHNHPSGDPTPSIQDIDFTNRVKEVAKMLDIELLDHIIVSERGYESI